MKWLRVSLLTFYRKFSSLFLSVKSALSWPSSVCLFRYLNIRWIKQPLVRMLAIFGVHSKIRTCNNMLQLDILVCFKGSQAKKFGNTQNCRCTLFPHVRLEAAWFCILEADTNSSMWAFIYSHNNVYCWMTYIFGGNLSMDSCSFFLLQDYSLSLRLISRHQWLNFNELLICLLSLFRFYSCQTYFPVRSLSPSTRLSLSFPKLHTKHKPGQPSGPRQRQPQEQSLLVQSLTLMRVM